MKDIFQIELTARELVVTAALLGYESIFGLEERDFLSNGIQMQSQIRQTVQQLEQKKLIRYDLNGTLHIRPNLRKIVECACCAKKVGCFSTNLSFHKKVVVYALENEPHTVLMEKSGSQKYKMLLTDCVAGCKIIAEQILASERIEMNEMLLLEEARLIQSKIEAFAAEEAKTSIRKHVQSEAAGELIVKILGGGCGYMSFQIHHRSKQFYKAVCNGLFVCVDGYTVSVGVDANDVIHFKGVSYRDIQDYISPYLALV